MSMLEKNVLKQVKAIAKLVEELEEDVVLMMRDNELKRIYNGIGEHTTIYRFNTNESPVGRISLGTVDIILEPTTDPTFVAETLVNSELEIEYDMVQTKVNSLLGEITSDELMKRFLGSIYDNEVVYTDSKLNSETTSAFLVLDRIFIFDKGELNQFTEVDYHNLAKSITFTNLDKIVLVNKQYVGLAA